MDFAHPKKLSISLKLLLFVLVSIFVVVSTQTWLNLRSAQQRIRTNETEDLQALYIDFNEEVQGLEQMAAALATGFADRLDIKRALVGRDRQRLLDLLTPLFESLQASYGIVQLYIYEPNSRSFLLVHDPEEYGIFSDNRPMIRAAMDTRQTVAGIEIDPSRLGVRGVAPMFDGDEFIGLVEVGLDYDQKFINVLKVRRWADYRMWVSYDAAAPTGLWSMGSEPESPSSKLFYYASTYSTDHLIPESVYLEVLQTGRPSIEFVSHKGDPLAVLVAPMKGYGGRTIGILEVIRSRSSALNTFDRDQNTTLTVSGLLIGLGLFLTLILVNYIVLRPLKHLMAVAEHQVRGDLSARVTRLPNDEFGQLGRMFNTMTEQLGDLINHLEERVKSRTRDLQIVIDVSRQITTVLDIDELLRQIVLLTALDFKLYACFIFLKSETNEMINGVAGITGGSRRILNGQDMGEIALSAVPSLVALAARTREAVYVSDVTGSPDYLSHVLCPDTRSELAIPMVLGNQLVGVFDLQAREFNRFGDEDIRVLKALAEQVTIAVRNAELFAEAKAARREAEEANRVKSQFLASMSHELRTPLNGVLNFTQFVASGMLGPVNERQADVLNKATANGEHLLSLINDVLDISKIESGSLTLFIEDGINLRDELSVVVATGTTMLENKPVELVVDVDENLPLLRGDKRRLRQIMLNLVSNACKFTESGRVTIRLHAQADEILFVVEDTGPGITPEDHNAIFESFRQTETGLRSGHGTGLGLPISKHLTEAHGGRIWVESEPDEGATFYCALPLHVEPQPVVSNKNVEGDHGK